MFAHHPGTFRHAHYDNARFGTERKLRRTDQVPNVLDEDQLQISQLDLAQAFSDKIRVEMAAVDRCDLHHRHILFRNRIGIVARGRIAVEHRYAESTF